MIRGQAFPDPARSCEAQIDCKRHCVCDSVPSPAVIKDDGHIQYYSQLLSGVCFFRTDKTSFASCKLALSKWPQWTRGTFCGMKSGWWRWRWRWRLGGSRVVWNPCERFVRVRVCSCVCVWWDLHGAPVAPTWRRSHPWLKHGAFKRHVTSPDASKSPVDVCSQKLANRGN